jgi:cytochrome c biogenesis protein
MTLSDSSDRRGLNAEIWTFWRRLLKIVADLRLAIVLLLLIAIFSISGTVIEQGQSLTFYQENYPEKPALFGFLTWKVVLGVGLNHVYSTWWFLALLAFFGSSLTACTFTRQLPALKAAQLWKFYQQPRQFEKLAFSTEIPTGSLTALTPLLEKRGYKVAIENNSLYARKGIMGRIGPIVVHAAMLIILAGAVWGALTGFFAQEMVASGESFRVQNIFEAGPLAQPQIPKDWGLKVNRFWIDYTPDGNIDQFYSDLSVINNQGEELDRKTIYVNSPLRYRGVTFYQTNWGIAAVRVQVNNSPTFQLRMGELKLEGGGRIWGTWVPTKPDLSDGVSLLAKDLQGTVLIYDRNGQLVSAVRVGSALEVNGVTLKVQELVGSTGLQIKADPGVPIVYLGFGLLMVGVVMSYVSHSQIWALEKTDSSNGGLKSTHFYFGGKTNRAAVSFEREMQSILEEIISSERELKSLTTYE